MYDSFSLATATTERTRISVRIFVHQFASDKLEREQILLVVLHTRWPIHLPCEAPGFLNTMVRKTQVIQPSKIQILMGSGHLYHVRLHPDFTETLHLRFWAREWSWWLKSSLAHLPDRVKMEVIVFETRPDPKSLRFFGLNWALFIFHAMTQTWLQANQVSVCTYWPSFRLFRASWPTL